MLFNSLLFLVFFAVVYGLYLGIQWTPVLRGQDGQRGMRLQNAMLVAASYLFYAAWDWRFLGLIVLSTAIDFLAARRIHASEDPGTRRRWLWVSLLVNLGALGLFKYAGFFAESLQDLAGLAGVELSTWTLQLALPVGISFYTFQTLSYTIDVYRGRLTPTDSPLLMALFVAFFPQLVAGPIERAADLIPQLQRPRRVGVEDLAAGAWLITYGFFLKLFVADNLAPVADAIFGSAAAPGSPDNGVMVLLGSYAFCFQIYGDFAGYSRIAAGLARLMGVRLTENFRGPFLAAGPSERWRVWHITLTLWIRDYVFHPLGGSRHWPRRNTLVTMVLVGLWHGAAWTFVVWGALEGLQLLLERWLCEPPESEGRVSLWLRLPRGVRVFLYFHVALTGFGLFRSVSSEQALAFAGHLVSSPWRATPEALAAAAKLLVFAGPVMLTQPFDQREEGAFGLVRQGWVPGWAVALGVAYLTLLFGEFGGGSFVYFQF